MRARNQGLLLSMAGPAARAPFLRMMRESAVAAAAIRVTWVRFHTRDVLLVAGRAKLLPQGTETKLMGSVTLSATRFAMKRLLALGRRVACRTGAHLRKVSPGGVWVVAARASPRSAMFRMVRVNLCMTFRTARRSGRFDVVRIVTVLTIAMRSG